MGTWSLVRTFVNDAGYTGTAQSSPYQATAPAAIPVGDLLRLTFQYGFGSDQTSVLAGTDTGSNTYNREAGLYDSTAGGGAATLSTVVATQLNNGDKVGVSWTGGTMTFLSVLVEQWHYSAGTPAGINGTPAAQAQANPGTGTDAVTSGNTTPTVNGCLICGSIVFSQNPPTSHTVGTGFTVTLDDVTAVQVYTEAFTQATAAGVAATLTISPTERCLTFVTAYAPPSGSGVDVLIRYGNVALTGGSGLITAAFLSTAVATLGGGYYLTRRLQDAMTTMDDL